MTRPDGALRAVLGTMGADAQPQVVLQMLVRLLHDGAGPGHAVGGGQAERRAPGQHQGVQTVHGAFRCQ